MSNKPAHADLQRYMAKAGQAARLAPGQMAAAMPVGTNPLLFAQSYRTQKAQTTAAIVISTLAFVVIAPMWLMVLGRV